MGHFVAYIIERRGPRQRVFAPLYFSDMRYAAYLTKRAALKVAREFRAEDPENEYRVTGYWDKRPW